MSLIRELHPERRPEGEAGEQRLSGMDVPRARPGPGRRIVWIVLGVLGLVALGLFVANLQPATPSVERDLLVFGTVRQGPMVRQIHGWGSLVPDRTQLVRAQEPGIVEAVYAVEGQTIRAGDRLVELSNSDVEIAVEKAAQKFAAARAGMIALSREQSARRLSLEASIADTRIQFLNAEDEFEELRARPPGQLRESELRRAREKLHALGRRLEADEERLALITASTEQQMAVRRDELRWVESILDSERERLEALTLRAAGDGTVERILVEPGSRVTGGDVLAEVTLSDRLKAVVKVYASDGSEVAVGQEVSLEAAGGRVGGTVSSVNPKPGSEVAEVTVALERNPPVPADGSQDVEALIHLSTLDDVTFVDRPVYAPSDGWTTVFRVAADSGSADRVKVRFGRGSVDRIEILSGLEPGDRIVVSDISEFDELDCFEIE